jgi:DNA topoisomerase-1
MYRLKDDIKIDKLEYKIDKYHTYTIAKYGPVIKCIKDNKTTFKSVRKDLDMEKLKNGGYDLDDILDIVNKSDNNLGMYKNKPVYLKKGKYGMYVNYDSKNFSIKTVKKKMENVTLEDVIPCLNSNKTNKNILKVLNEDISIRTGKYGPYIFYKTKDMTKPKFINIKNQNLNTITIESVLSQL